MIRRYDQWNNRLSAVVSYNGMAFTAGQVAEDNAGGSIEEQSKEVLARLDDVLAKAGSDKSRILFASVWLSDVNDAKVFNSFWDKWVPEGCAPARACVEAKLVSPDYIVEVAVIAAVGE